MNDETLKKGNELKKQIEDVQKEKNTLEKFVKSEGLSVSFYTTFFGALNTWTVAKRFINVGVFIVLTMDAIDKELERLKLEYKILIPPTE